MMDDEEWMEMRQNRDKAKRDEEKESHYEQAQTCKKSEKRSR